jgi:hypothetical protein
MRKECSDFMIPEAQEKKKEKKKIIVIPEGKIITIHYTSTNSYAFPNLRFGKEHLSCELG